MWDFWARLFDPSGFPPRWQCGAWDAGLGWLHILSDLAIWAAYFAIPCILGCYAYRRKDIPFRGVLHLFVAFILLCGLTHFLNAVMFWWPAYRLDGLLKLLTAVVSWFTVVALVRVTPHLLALRSPIELEREIAERQRAEGELRALQADLEKRVAQRTAELQAAVTALAAEAEVRNRAERRADEMVRVYRAIGESINYGVWVCDPDGRNTYASPSFLTLVGITQEQCSEFGWGDVLHPDDVADTIAAWKECVRVRGRWEREHRFRGADGRYHPVLAVGVPVENEKGELVCWCGINLDINRLKQVEANLRMSEARFRAVFEATPSGLILADQDGQIVLVNDLLVRKFGWEKADLIGQPVELLLPERYREGHPALRDSYFAAPAERAMGAGRDLTGRRKDGSEFPVEVGLRPVEMSGQVFTLASVINITARKRMEAERQESEERFRGAFEHTGVAMVLTDIDNRFLRVNAAFADLFGYPPDEMVGLTMAEVTHAEDVAASYAQREDLLAGAIRYFQIEKRYVRSDGQIFWGLTNVSLVRDTAGRPQLYVGQVQDITERKRAEELVKASLREKEVLLKEIHHRVKNNLQIVSTLLDLQGRQTTDTAAVEMFRESRGRVKSMALIHERLYRSGDLAGVDFAEYTRQLARDLFGTYRVAGDIRLELAVDIPPLPIDIAIPCGLLLNELISNCLKHAFPGGAAGLIRIALRQDGGVNILTVTDDGAGFPAGTDFRDTASFGMRLVNTLVEQLLGDIDLNTERGTTFTVRFPNPTSTSTAGPLP